MIIPTIVRTFHLFRFEKLLLCATQSKSKRDCEKKSRNWTKRVPLLEFLATPCRRLCLFSVQRDGLCNTQNYHGDRRKLSERGKCRALSVWILYSQSNERFAMLPLGCRVPLGVFEGGFLMGGVTSQVQVPKSNQRTGTE